jgi:hypothetical protein
VEDTILYRWMKLDENYVATSKHVIHMLRFCIKMQAENWEGESLTSCPPVIAMGLSHNFSAQRRTLYSGLIFKLLLHKSERLL